MMVFKTNGPQIHCILHGSLRLSSVSVELQKDLLVDKNLSKGKNNF